MCLRSLPRITFVVLVLATLAAFFIAQRLKRTEPLVNNVRVTKFFSPNGDRYKNRARLSFITRKQDSVTVSVVDDSDNEVRRLASDAHFTKGRHVFHWNGRNDLGRRLPDGVYHLRVGLRAQGRTATTPLKIFLDTTPPRPIVTVVKPDWISPGQPIGGTARIHFSGPTSYRPQFLVYRTSVKGAHLVARIRGRRGSTAATWDGLVKGHPARAGNYLIAVRVRDAAGNLGVGPRQLPPRRAETNGHPGVVVRYIAAITPAAPITAGNATQIEVRTRRPHFTWLLRKLGSRRVVAHGKASGHTLHLRTAGAHTGIYMLRLSDGHKRSFTTPVAIRERQAEPVLVVTSFTTWQGTNPLDSNGDGWPDVLGLEPKVPLQRPFANGLPQQFTWLEQPFFLWLDRSHLRYDLTTDYALAKSANLKRQLSSYSAIIFAGSELFPTARISSALRDYVTSGGTIVSLGTNAFRRTATVTATRISNPSPQHRHDSFGELLTTVKQPLGPITVLLNRKQLFDAQSSSTFGQFTQLEEAKRLPAGAKLEATAGVDSGRPAFVLFRSGKGTIMRSGSIQWNQNLSRSSQVRLVMGKIWSLPSH